MADAKAAVAAAPAADAKGSKKKGGGAKLIMGMMLFGMAVPFIMPTLLFLVCMLPTVVAMLTEPNSNRKGSSITAIGAMNAAGIVPFVIDLWAKGQTMEHAYLILGNSQTWLVVLAAAAIGKLILYAVPQVIAGATLASAEGRVRQLKDNLEILKMTWGPDVATTKPLDKIGKGE